MMRTNYEKSMGISRTKIKLLREESIESGFDETDTSDSDSDISESETCSGPINQKKKVSFK